MHSTISSGDQFLYLLRCAVRQEAPAPEHFPVEATDWQALYTMAQKQAVVGLVFWAVRLLPREVQPPRKEIFLPWLSDVESIYSRSEQVRATCRRVTERFHKEGFHACLLKGQSAASLYPDYRLRTTGDIDLWIWPTDVTLGARDSLRARRARIIKYVRRYFPHEEAVYHHIDFNMLSSTQMELHFTPSWMNSPRRNGWLQHWFEREAPRQFGEVDGEAGFRSPTPDFNAVYMLLHIFRHLFNEGIGLRQIVDYYYLLQQPDVFQQKEKIVSNLRHLGLLRFCGALMWVLHELFGLEEAQMLVPPRQQEGRHLLSEILLAGNFGKADTRFSHYADGTFGAFYTRSLRNMGFLREYPSEVFWTPLWKIGQYFWRKKMGYL